MAEKKEKVAAEEEAELRRVVQALFEQEENLLSFHMSCKIQVSRRRKSCRTKMFFVTHVHSFPCDVQENAELLTEEGKLLQNVQREEATQEYFDEYASRLASILDRKIHLIQLLEDRMAAFRAQLKKEEELSRRVGNLSQY